MFNDCQSLELLNINFNTKNVENMAYMFASCTKLSSLNITMFDIDNINNFTKIFDNDYELELYIDIFKCKDFLNEIPDYIKIIDVPTTPSTGQIECLYDINTVAKNTTLLGNEFINNYPRIEIYIDGNKIQYTKEYKFKDLGNHNIIYILYEDLNMDYMFKDVPDLISVKMKSENNCQILSMISTFENSESLYEFRITGFSGNRIKSMKKLFYGTNIYIY